MIAIKTIFIKYLLLPLLAMLLMGVMYLVQKKSALANNRRLIIYVLLAGLLLALPGLGGMAGSTFSPYWYLFAQVIFLLLGVLHVNLLGLYFKKIHAKKGMVILFESLVTLLCMVLGGYLFTLLFAWLSPFQGFAWMAVTAILVFPVPLLFYYCWLQFTAIPFDIYKVWVYNPHLNAISFEGADFDKLMVLNVEFTKKLQQGERFTVKAKSPPDIKLGDWFYRFIEDYNLKYPQSPIEVIGANGEPYAWIFYTKPSFFHRRRYLDFNETIATNRISERMNIICKRVVEHEEEKVVNLKRNMLTGISE